MKTKLSAIGILLSLCVSTLFAQETKKSVFVAPVTEPYTWNVFGPTLSLNGPLARLEILTRNKIKDISFTLQWYLKKGEPIVITKDDILNIGDREIENDISKFATDSIWQTIYILSIPDVNAWDVTTISFSGKFLTKGSWNIMDENIVACHTK